MASANRPAELFPEPVEIIRKFQAENGTAIRRPQPGDRVGFAFSTMDRLNFTQQTLEALDAEGDFDIIWNDGSRETAVPALARSWGFRHARMVEFNESVRGGPDAAIHFGLNRLLALGYDYVGLIENDVVLEPGWFGSLMNLFNLAADEGLVCGAASVRGFASRVLEYRNGYTLDWASGAGMLLLSRAAAQLLADNYYRPIMGSRKLAEFYAENFGIYLQCSEWEGDWREQPLGLTLDWDYTPFLYTHGFATLNSIPTRAHDLEFDVRTTLHTTYIDITKNNLGLAHPRLK